MSSTVDQKKGGGLTKGRLGVFGIVFFVVAASAPMAGMTGTVPVATVIGSGTAVPVSSSSSASSCCCSALDSPR